MVLFEFRAKRSAANVNSTSTVRSRRRNCRSPRRGANGRMTFSVNSAVGASSAPLAVERIAESSAPKKSTCAHIGVLLEDQIGQDALDLAHVFVGEELPNPGSMTSAA